MPESQTQTNAALGLIPNSSKETQDIRYGDLVVNGFINLIGKHDPHGESDKNSQDSSIKEYPSSDEEDTDEDSDEEDLSDDEVSTVLSGAASTQEDFSADDVNDECSGAFPTEEDIAATQFKPERDVAAVHKKLQKDLFDSLRSSLLPRLRQQITSMSLSLDPTNLLKSPDLHLKLILDIQSEFELTWAQIEFAVRTIGPALSKSLPEDDPDDPLHKEFKNFRTGTLRRWLHLRLTRHVFKFFKEAYASIQQLQLSHQTPGNSSPRAFSSTRKSRYASSVLEDIDDSIEWLTKSEICLVQLDWPNKIQNISLTLTTLQTFIIHETTRSQRKKKRSKSKARSESAIQFVKSLLPIAKLSRLFCNKQLEWSANHRSLPLSTELSSQQLRTLVYLPVRADDSLDHLRDLLRKENWEDESIDCSALRDVVNDIRQAFEYALFLIPLHFVPLIPNTNGYLSQDYFRNWFTTWSTQWNLAMVNVSRSIQLLER
ncbi:hypothetical protein PGT21_025391 [Puccinia graminis f. sp. tritici]|uniref:Uncharacterized protein n=1 Tax=Puccinia graminis f. sp. tritici TaxID=56615 RepID=A0A5B0PYP4_PUCGR|nr:hypothetical protein PGT21_025391 [Puccinia graminis f. sp. tritici]KAA1120952.1 hypothetical protein PGTUg99_022079 [Puccinia graminis f. sp. tritici]